MSALAELREREARARAAQRTWARLSVAERVAAVRAGLGYFRDQAARIAEDITRSMGKPIVQSENELKGFFERADWLCEAAPRVLAGDALPPKAGFERAIAHEPLGVVFIISAWNYPLLISVNGVVAALLAGNAVLLRHARLTRVMGEHFARAFGRLAGIDDVLQHVVAEHEPTLELIARGGVDHVIFTGSVEGGRAVKRATAERFCGCNLELGGKDGAYVAADADVRQAADSITDGAIYNAGQSCCGIERCYVHADVFEDFLAACRPLIQAYVLGDPFDRRTTLGPLAGGEGAAAVLARQVDGALAAGARLELGGHVHHVRQLGACVFFEPTLIVVADNALELMQEENFGPVLPLMRVRGDDEALGLINDSRYGLTAAIYSRDRARAQAFAAGARVGTVYLNRCDYLDPALPWTGVGDSGLGSALSPYGFHALTRRKAIHFRLPSC